MRIVAKVFLSATTANYTKSVSKDFATKGMKTEDIANDEVCTKLHVAVSSYLLVRVCIICCCLMTEKNFYLFSFYSGFLVILSAYYLQKNYLLFENPHTHLKGVYLQKEQRFE
ncbi:hypothetical protein FIU95_20795 [Microbulbifer sp. THAF38]|nr:hypothetical protein FIU95_20795 [Microbulbifer sp. THAF38]